MKKSLLAVLGLVVLSNAPALANPSWEDVSLRTALAAMDSATVPSTPGTAVRTAGSYLPHTTRRAPAGEPAVLATFVTAGVTNPGVACFACVPGAQNPNDTAGISSPLSYVDPSVVHLDYILFYQDFSFNGACAESIVVSAGKTVLFKAMANFTLYAGTGSFIGTGQARPTYTGPALLVGKIACPGTPATSTKTTLYFQ